MTLAYIIHNFPKASETFIAREVLLLRSLGVNVRCHSIKSPTANELKKLSEEYRELEASTHYPSIADLLIAIALHPVQFSRALRLASTMLAGHAGRPNRLLLAVRALWLVMTCQKERAEHIHAHWPYGSMLAFIAHHLSGLPFSVSIHAHEVAHENAHFKVIFPALQFAAFCNRAAMEYAMASLSPDERKKCHLIYHGVDLARFSPTEMPGTENGIHILSAGRFTPTKGFDRLVKACAKARKVGLEVHLTLLGAGAEEEKIRSVAYETGFSDYLQLPGWLSHDQLARNIAGAHCIALLADTNYHDGLPNIIVEGMASGRPAIVSALPAARELIDHGVNGIILEDKEDETHFIEAVRLLSQPGKLQRLGAKARSAVVEKLDDRLMIRKMKGLFSKSIGKPREEILQAE